MLGPGSSDGMHEDHLHLDLARHGAKNDAYCRPKPVLPAPASPPVYQAAPGTPDVPVATLAAPGPLPSASMAGQPMPQTVSPVRRHIDPADVYLGTIPDPSQPAPVQPAYPQPDYAQPMPPQTVAPPAAAWDPGLPPADVGAPPLVWQRGLQPALSGKTGGDVTGSLQ
ncbi:hypothetical protein A6302_02613 [Methylobrevis pamukkalensis]|uniref:Extensin-like C-terminal domain-containing protein n=1 Tax=Methylobrevis pamukkalensis TaxID=1439726 RepID=A0A1E3H169_9HYPH|nr:hypothetical protein A6302_02613 [Methylobrevis pamukkalensis]